MYMDIYNNTWPSRRMDNNLHVSTMRLLILISPLLPRYSRTPGYMSVEEERFSKRSITVLSYIKALAINIYYVNLHVGLILVLGEVNNALWVNDGLTPCVAFDYKATAISNNMLSADAESKQLLPRRW